MKHLFAFKILIFQNIQALNLSKAIRLNILSILLNHNQNHIFRKIIIIKEVNSHYKTII